MIDLHVHTTASDGQFSPSQIIQMAVDKGLSRIAITDHDTAAGLEEAKAAAQELKINFVAGTELNISFPTGEFHLLGLGFTNISPSLNEIFEDLVKSRQERNENIISKMQKDGVQISLEEVQKDYPDIDYELLLGDSTEIESRIASDRVDCGYETFYGLS